MKTVETGKRTARAVLPALLLIGLGLEALLWARGWVYGDQTKLLSLGWQFARDGELLPIGGRLTGGLRPPGSLLQVLVGLPLTAWPHFRSPVLLAQASHLAAVGLLVHTLGRSLGRRFALIFLVGYWYSPWFLYQAGFLWEPSYVLLPAALHLWACQRLRSEAGWLPSLVLAGAVVAGVQLHPSAVILLFASAILLLRRKIRIRWPAGAIGAALAAIPLVPFLAGLRAGTLAWSPWPDGGAGMRPVESGLKGLVYWFRLGSADLGRRFRETIFCDGERLEAGCGMSLLCVILAVVMALSVASVVVSVLANGWFFRVGRRRTGSGDESLGWWRAYAGAFFGASLVASALAPGLVQGWYFLVALHAAALPVAAWFDWQWTRSARWPQRLLAALVLLRIAGVLLIAFGHPMYLAPPPEVQQHVILEHLQELVPNAAPGPRP